jgi:muconolactone delta-isomerase
MERPLRAVPAGLRSAFALRLSRDHIVPASLMLKRLGAYARLWRRLAEFRTWRPLADIENLRETLKTLPFSGPEDVEIAEWLASIRKLERGPDLIQAGRAARSWMNLAGVKDRNPDGVFFAACLWQEKNPRAPIPLPFWSAPEQRFRRLELQFGLAWMAEFLECVAAAALVGLHELNRLQEAEKKGRMMGTTVRSRLSQAVDAVLRAHIVTAAGLAKSIRVTPQAALGLLGQLAAAGLVREVTGRASWRAYALI